MRLVLCTVTVRRRRDRDGCPLNLSSRQNNYIVIWIFVQQQVKKGPIPRFIPPLSRLTRFPPRRGSTDITVGTRRGHRKTENLTMFLLPSSGTTPPQLRLRHHPFDNSERTPCRTGPRPNNSPDDGLLLFETRSSPSVRIFNQTSESPFFPARPPHISSLSSPPPKKTGPLFPSTSRTWNPAPPPISDIQDRRSKMHGTGDDPANPHKSPPAN